MKLKSLKSQFDKNGFVNIQDFFGAEEIEEIKNSIQHYLQTKVPILPDNKVFYEMGRNAKYIKQLFDLSDYDPYFQHLLRGSKIEKMAKTLLGENVGNGSVEYFNKPAGVGKPTPPHQDCYYFMLTPPQALTFWIPLEDVDEENGCLRYIKGSHKK